MFIVVSILIIAANIAIFATIFRAIRLGFHNSSTHPVEDFGTVVSTQLHPTWYCVLFPTSAVYDVLLEYTYDGVTYESQAKYPVRRLWRNDYLEDGADVRIRINPDDPEDVLIWDR